MKIKDQSTTDLTIYAGFLEEQISDYEKQHGCKGISQYEYERFRALLDSIEGELLLRLNSLEL